MEKTGWKILAIIFMVLFIVETLFLVWALALAYAEEEKTYECYYDICNGSADALYDTGVCYCYDYDNLGGLVVSKTEYMKN